MCCILFLRLICAHGSELVSDSDTAGITSTPAISVDENEDNSSEPSRLLRTVIISSNVCLTRTRTFALFAKPRFVLTVQPVAPAMGAHLRTRKLLSWATIPHVLTYSAKPAGRNSLNSVVLQRVLDTAKFCARIAPLCGDYAKPSLLDIKSGYSDDSPKISREGKS